MKSYIIKIAGILLVVATCVVFTASGNSKVEEDVSIITSATTSQPSSITTTEYLTTTTTVPETTTEAPTTTKPVIATTKKVITTTTTKPYVKSLKSSNVSQTIWNYMKGLGWNDYVCAGILGNMMSEAGGQTLNIDPYIRASGYYGICQWSTTYYPQVNGADLNTQLQVLEKTIEEAFEGYGNRYKPGFDFDDFLSLTNEKEAALAFAKAYERCASGSYSIRQTNASAAYSHFVKA